MSLHTETLNIWSHLFGAAWSCYSAVRFAATDTSPRAQDAVVILVYLTATTFCFACSTLCHLFADHVSEGSWLYVDHIGIVCAIWASSISFVLFTFNCQQSAQRAYLALITSAAVLCLHRLSSIHSHGLEGQRRRIGTHFFLGGLAVLPGIHGWCLHSLSRDPGLLAPFWGLVVVNSAGGTVYVSHLLDKAVGMDLGMPDSSHHVMHVMVLAGTWIYTRGLLSVYRARAAGTLGQCV